jgi:hypothetical protein
MMKTCSKCKEAKSSDEFYARTHSKDGLQNLCKSCAKIHSRASRYKLNYGGLTVSDYDLLLSRQGGCCAICNTTEPGASRRLHVDHCHTNGNVRGLLCFNCNLGIGKLKDDPVLCTKAADYLINPPHLGH